MNQLNDSSNEKPYRPIDGKAGKAEPAMDDSLILDDDDFVSSAPDRAIDRSDDAQLMPKKTTSDPENPLVRTDLETIIDWEPVGTPDGQQSLRSGTKLCPRCMQMIDRFTEQIRGTEVQYFCPSCSETVQFRYARDYDQTSRVKLSLAGMSGHGKTMFLRGIYASLNSLGRKWKGFRFAPLSDDDANAFNIATGESSRGGLADPSQLAERPVGFQLNGVPGAGNVHLLIYDISGEAFDTSTKLTKHAFFIPKSEVVTLILSLSDMSAGHQLAFLLSRLVDAIRAKGEDPRTKSLIVVLTKGDQLRFDQSLPESAESFLSNEVSSDPRDLNGLQQLSDDLQEWLRTHPDNYWNFVESAQDEFQNVRYTVISSLGSAPGSGSDRTQVQMNPRNVISPLLWLFRFTLPWIRVTNSNAPVAHYYDFCTALDDALVHNRSRLLFELSPGDHRVRETLTFSRDSEIRGDTMNTTRVFGDPGKVIVDVKRASFSATGVTFVANATLPSSTVAASGAAVCFKDCRFTGAVRSQTESRLGHGLHISGDSTGEIVGSEFVGNEGNGLLIEGRSRVNVRRCKSSNNRLAGFRFLGSAIVTAADNEAVNNTHGIYVSEKSKVQLTHNCCGNNTEAGIHCSGNTSGEAAENITSNDRRFGEPAKQKYGFVLRDATNVDLRDNRCCNNVVDGILARSTSRSVLKGNKASNNGGCGVRVIERARMMLDSNQCNMNSYGIHVHCSARGTRVKRNNQCSGNRNYQVQNLRSPVWTVLYYLSVMLYDDPIGPNSPDQ